MHLSLYRKPTDYHTTTTGACVHGHPCGEQHQNHTCTRSAAGANLLRRSRGRRGAVGEEEGGDAEDREDNGGVVVLGLLVRGSHLLPVDLAAEAVRDAVRGAHLRDGGARLDGNARREGADGVALEQLATARLGVLLLLESIRIAVLSVHAHRRARHLARRHADLQGRGDGEKGGEEGGAEHGGARSKIL